MTYNRQGYLFGQMLKYVYRVANGNEENYKAILKSIGFTKAEIERDRWISVRYVA